MKRLLDICLSAIGLCASLPLWMIISFAIWLEDRGPIFYFHERVGINGKIFISMKFRSMRHEAKKESIIMQACENDSRTTRTGKILRATAMDELPQLLSILAGDMSFVGPRALVPKEREVGEMEERSVFNIPGFRERSSVRPGLTGVAQIIGTHDLPRAVKFKYDIWYVRNRGFRLDIYLILLSFLVTFLGKWESREEKIEPIVKPLKERIGREILQDTREELNITA